MKLTITVNTATGKLSEFYINYIPASIEDFGFYYNKLPGTNRYHIGCSFFYDHTKNEKILLKYQITQKEYDRILIKLFHLGGENLWQIHGRPLKD